ncbi:HAD-IA family hydrolase [Anaeromyxobacter oryzae]|uniref:VOC domain-containing protein n=1 Tax=Anaeromyxobacter oryzae TaxID=2918170 RepID=A0ABM7WP26_9BACT|nr:HAD-IA family hydrolase [Anaeromyxobacter oryzae]BDG01216.1 hypothetical protein AMOR_02120 [Anaeromyxobacter oryzae]
MKVDHVGIEVQDLYAMELFYRRALGFEPAYRYVSRNTPGLRTVFLRRGGVSLELLERPRDEAFLARRAAAPDHLSLEVEDVDAEHARLAALALPGASLRPPRDTGDGYREAELRDPEGNVVELSVRIRPPPPIPVRGVIFDLDGTLVDSEEVYYEADRAVLARRGVTLTREDKRRYIGRGSLEMMIDVRSRHGLAESAADLLAEKNREYLALAGAGTRVYPEMRRLLDLVRARGVPVAVASGSSPVVLETLLDALDLASAFAAVVSAEQAGRGKPAPDVFLEAARRLGLPPQECLVVEDSPFGVEAAKRAFMSCIAVPYLLDAPLPDAFVMADLLFPEGMAGFDAAQAFAWIEARLAE